MPAFLTIFRVLAISGIVSAMAIGVSGCNKKDKSATQVVASVDGEEISVHQINGVLSKATNISPENLPKVKADILGGLVEQQLAINMAISKKLDRTPEVVAAIESAKRDIIARAALEQIASALPKPTDEEAQQYFTKNPALFSQRRLFSLQELAVRKPGKEIERIRTKVATAKSIEDVQAWLKDNQIEFAANSGVRPAEQIPLEVLPQLQAFKDGQLGLIESKDAYLVMRLVASRSQPVTEAQALPTIKTFLFNQRSAEAIKLAKADMKTKAKIEYFGEFAGGEAVYKAKAEADVKAAADAATQAKAKAVSEADALAKQKADEQAASQAEQDARAKARADARAQTDKDQSGAVKPDAVNLEKGIKGLK